MSLSDSAMLIKMKTKRIKYYRVLLICSFAISCVSVLMAQPSEVKILDFSMSPVPLSNISNQQQQTDSIELVIQFKINTPANASMAHISFAKTVGANDIFEIHAPFIEETGIYYLRYNVSNYAVLNRKAKLLVKCKSEDYYNCKSVSLFVEDKEGKKSNTIGF